MIKLTNITKKFKNKILYENINIEIKENGLYSIIGNNGSGKTTLLKIIANLIKPTSGSVINDYNTVYIDNEHTVFSNLTVKENLEIISNNEEKIKEVIDLVDINDVIDRINNNFDNDIINIYITYIFI